MAKFLKKKIKRPNVPVQSVKPLSGRKKNRGRMGRIVFGVLVGLATLAVIFFIWARAQGELSVTENAVGSLLTPVQSAVVNAGTWIRERVDGIRDRNQLYDDYDAAQLEIETLKYRVSQLEEAAKENERLTQLLDAKSRYEQMDPLYARIVVRDPGVWFDTFTINRGTMDGVEANMAVITGDGLVGRVIEAGLNYSKVLSIIDSRSAVACLIERTRDNGVLRGQLTSASENSDLFMYYLPSVNGITPNDQVITSGVDGLYPKGITIGTVRGISRQTDTSDQYIIVSPAADFQRLEDVLVLRVVVENGVEDALPRLPDPTPRPRATVSASPSETPGTDQTPAPSQDPGNWDWPSAQPGETAEPETSEAPVTDVGGIIEDQWAEE